MQQSQSVSGRVRKRSSEQQEVCLTGWRASSERIVYGIKKTWYFFMFIFWVVLIPISHWVTLDSTLYWRSKTHPDPHKCQLERLWLFTSTIYSLWIKLHLTKSRLQEMSFSSLDGWELLRLFKCWPMLTVVSINSNWPLTSSLTRWCLMSRTFTYYYSNINNIFRPNFHTRWKIKESSTLVVFTLTKELTINSSCR